MKYINISGKIVSSVLPILTINMRNLSHHFIGVDSEDLTETL